MALDDKEIEKYIFDPKNPKQCKSYKLLLNIAKKENFVYVSQEFVAHCFQKIIINNDFRDKLWDQPDGFDNLDIMDKIKLFKTSLSEKEYFEHIDSLKITVSDFTYNHVFQSFIDLHPFLYITKLKRYDEQLLRSKLYFDNSHYSFAGYKSYKDNFTFIQNYFGHKIFFTNDADDLKNYDTLFDVSSVLITVNQDIFIDLKKSAVVGKRILRQDINENIKPIFLKKMGDVYLLLNILQNDLKKEKSQDNIGIEAICTLESIKIKDFFSIKDIELQNLQDKKEIYIVGENGDGKTLLLQALALGLKGIDDGDVFDLVKSQKEYDICIEDEQKNIYNTKEKIYKNFFAYGANRNSSCRLKEDEKGYLTLFNATLDLKNPISWLQYLDHREKSGENNIVSSSQIKKLLQEILHSDVEIEITPDEVTFRERGAPVTFEQLSAGYTGVITIVIDLLSRLSENQSEVATLDEFRGVVVIDEVELHLHPKWKYDFVNKLRDIFPNIQFIMTTHSPTVILGASKEAVFYKIYKEDGKVKISNQIANEGYTSNTLISSPLFDLSSITSREYEKPVSNKDDFIYEQIHERISKKISMESLEDKEKIAKLIDKELAKL